ncbi:MAG TPA: error-prone DNA polymerase, partial [Burkholderiaceae bacterium]
DYPVVEAQDVDRLHRQAAWMSAVFGDRARIGLTLLQRAFDEAHRASLDEVALQHRMPLVAAGHVCMHVRSRKPMHDMLTAVRMGCSVADAGYALSQNAEQHLRSRLRLANVYPRKALEETIRVAGECKFSLDELRYEYPNELIPAGHTPASYLREATFEGAHERYPDGIPQKVLALLEKELELIADLRYEFFFITVYDVVKFARGEGILCQGRGSAANSAVCYCLGVTAVNPNESDVLIERFLSRERAEPPDIDVDFEHQRREEVIQYVYKKYGRHRAAIAATVICYRAKSALRDSGKALGVDLAVVEKVAKSHHWFDSASDFLARVEECGLDPTSKMAQEWAWMAQLLRGFPRHLSQHVGGFVIAQDKLSRLVPIENASMKERSVIQWDKDDLEELGLLKVDVLALGMLSAMQRAFDLYAQRHGTPLHMHSVPREDAATYDMICQADTIGVFQIESRAQMSMLPRLRPRTYYDLVVQVAIVRPGPITGGMVHPYLQRREGRQLPECEPRLAPALKRTLGVPIFQEQVMQIAMLAADYSAGQADQLRRDMAAWKKKGNIQQHLDRIKTNMVNNGFDGDFADQICKQITGFGEYGFPESHAASFALLTYVSSWIKCHEPAIFLCALLNSQPMGFYSPSQLVQDGKRHGIEVRPIDVAISCWDSTLEEQPAASDGVRPQPAVRLGLSRLYGMRPDAAKRIVAARAERPVSSVADLARRADLDRHDLQVLAGGNALKDLVGNRRQAVWEAVGAVPD